VASARGFRALTDVIGIVSGWTRVEKYCLVVALEEQEKAKIRLLH